MLLYVYLEKGNKDKKEKSLLEKGPDAKGQGLKPVPRGQHALDVLGEDANSGGAFVYLWANRIENGKETPPEKSVEWQLEV